MRFPSLPLGRSLPALLALLAGCAASEPAPGAHAPIRIDHTEAIPPEFLPGLEALELAVRDGDEAVARRILAGLHARQPQGRTLGLAHSFERILDGRIVARGLDLRLSAEELDDRRGSYRIVLHAAHPLEETVVLRPSMARLSETLTTVDPSGSEQRSTSSSALERLTQLALPPGEASRFELAELVLPPVAGILAIRAQVRLTLLPGGLSLGERALPAQDLRVQPVECVRLAGHLPPESIAPAELLRYVLEERVRRPALMERAVRILPARRAEALDLLAGDVQRLSLLACEDLVPALRWLSDERSPGGDPAAWREWLLARAERRGAGLDSDLPRSDVPRLDLPRLDVPAPPDR